MWTMASSRDYVKGDVFYFAFVCLNYRHILHNS